MIVPNFDLNILDSLLNDQILLTKQLPNHNGIKDYVKHLQNSRERYLHIIKIKDRKNKINKLKKKLWTQNGM